MTEKRPEPKAPLARVSDRKPNPDGVVFVAEWHHILDGKTTMHRPPEKFRGDLERLYRLGFRPVTATEYLEDRMELPPGASPVVMTFDDSNPTQFRLLPDGTVDPRCGVGIWKAFAERHPDFPVRGTFFVLPDVMWGQPKEVKRKVEMLREWGSEIANHTVTHPILKRLSDEAVKREIAVAEDRLRALGAEGPIPLALPFGSSPKNRALLAGFTYQGREYKPSAAFLVGADPAPAPGPRLKRTAVPRIQAYDGELSLDVWLDRLEKGQVKPYVR